MRADIHAPARAGGEEYFLKRNDAQNIFIHRFHSFLTTKNSDIAASGGGAKKQKTKNSDDCLESIQAEAHSNKARRDRIFAAGFAKGFEEGKESGFALGLAEGKDKGTESAARANTTEIASLKPTNEAVHKQLCHILEQSNGIATVTGQLIAS
jgi:flagellar biosynthesis/type III secretory pathway protein FliH